MQRWVFFLLAALYFTLPNWLLQGAKMGYTVDANATLQATREMVEHHTLWPKERPKQGILPAVLHIPGFMWARAMVPVPPDAESYDMRLRWFDRRALMVESGLATGLSACLLLWTALQLGLTCRRALGVATLYAFAGMALAYARYDYQLPWAALGAAGWIAGGITWIRTQQRRMLWFAGFSLGFLVLVRLELAVMALGSIALIQRPPDTEHQTTAIVFRPWTPLLVAVGLPFAIGLGLAGLFQFIAWGRLSGGYEGGFSSTPLAGIHGFLFSLGKSLFLYNPPLLLMPWALWAGRHLFRQESGLISFSLLPAFLIYAWWSNWWGGWGWGPRHLVPLLPLFFIPLAFLLDRSRQNDRPMIVMLFILGIVGLTFQLTSMAIDFNDGILYAWNQLDRQTQAMGSSINDTDKELVTVYLWPWSGLSIHLQAALSFPIREWDIGLFHWADRGPSGRWLFILTAWAVWACLGWMMWRQSGTVTIHDGVRERHE